MMQCGARFQQNLLTGRCGGRMSMTGPCGRSLPAVPVKRPGVTRCDGFHLVPQSGSSWFVVELGFRQCSFMRREKKAFFYPFLSSYSPSSRSSLGSRHLRRGGVKVSRCSNL
ncbi:unnamed protein product [Gadus morhua 'NCC']